MLDEQDIKKMLLKDTKQKKEEGMVYGTVGKITDFNPLGKFKLSKEATKTLNDLFELKDLQIRELQEKQTILKDAILNINDKLKFVEEILAKYGME